MNTKEVGSTNSVEPVKSSVPDFGSFQTNKSKAKFYILAAVCGLAFIAAGFLIYNSNRDSGDATSTQAVQNLEARAALDSGNVNQLRTVAKSIKNAGHYDTDPNRLYILTLDAISRSDPEAADSYLARLKKNYDPFKGLDGLAGSKLQSFDQLQTQITYLKNYEKSNAANNANFNTSTASPSVQDKH